MGKPLEPTRVNHALKKSLHAVGIKHHIRVHDLRHTSASLALRRGIAGKVVQEMLGHSNYSTTTGIYSHMGPDIHKEASKQMNVDLSLAEMNTKELVKKCQKDLVRLNYQVFPQLLFIVPQSIHSRKYLLLYLHKFIYEESVTCCTPSEGSYQ